MEKLFSEAENSMGEGDLGLEFGSLVHMWCGVPCPLDAGKCVLHLN